MYIRVKGRLLGKMWSSGSDREKTFMKKMLLITPLINKLGLLRFGAILQKATFLLTLRLILKLGNGLASYGLFSQSEGL
jgi:hypothetical protein